jgi:hypothetical protein
MVDVFLSTGEGLKVLNYWAVYCVLNILILENGAA